MIEVPAAAIAADHFDAEFFSIGSNDLTQYVAAAGRDIGAVADLADPVQPAMERLLRFVVDVARAQEIDVSLCGDAGGDPRAIPRLLATGLRSLSMAPALVGRRETRGGGCRLAFAAGARAMAEMKPERVRGDAVSAYKAVLKRILDTRPSGTRHRLAIALGKNRSFISQIANPVYAVPIPRQHLDTIFEICHFTAADRREFLAAYAEAHPRSVNAAQEARGHAQGDSHGARFRRRATQSAARRDPRRNRAPPGALRRRRMRRPPRSLRSLPPKGAHHALRAAGRALKPQEDAMKKLINAPDLLLAESLAGFAAAHADIVSLGAEHKFVRRRELQSGKVALISGGGSGHEPLHAGFVGRGMLDAACPGQVFTSPTPDQMVAAVEAVETGGGCLFIVKNYEGDLMNFQMAAELAGREVATVVTDDDVAVEKSTWSTGRRGVAGTLIVEKIVGAAAEQGASLAELKALGDKVNGQTRSMGVALTSCTVPAAGKPTFVLAEDEMELGVGIHGEPGRRRVKLSSADTIADEMVGAIVNDLAPGPGAEALLLVNGFGGTPAMELYLMVNSALRVLRGRGVRVSRFLTGNYVTSLEMAGCSITVSLLDETLRSLWDAPVHTAALRWGV